MCGIAGFFTTGKIIDRSDLELMTDALSHRGPDAAGYFHNGTTGLGHRRLSILDLSESANQPMLSSNGRYQIIFNGEVYNFKEIAKDLDVPLKTTGDTEVLLEAYAKWGKEFVHKLNGMFLIVVYDQQEQDLFVARDRMGIKPLYYYYDGSTFAFASELKGLKAFGPLKGKLSPDKDSIREFMYLGYVPAPNSIYSQVKKFPKGSYMTLPRKGGELNIETYYSLPKQVKADVLSNEKEATDRLDELVNSSVKYRMISDVPFGTFLSGGVDSSLVTAVAQNNSSTAVNTFSIGFKEAKFNESAYAKQVADRLGTKHHEFTVSHSDAIELFDDILKVYDEPFADSSSVPTMLVSKLARQHVTMTLSGDGGDETYLGYGMYRWANRLSMTGMGLLKGPAALALSMGDNRMKRAANMFRYKGHAKLKSHIFSQEQYYFTEQEIDKLMLPNQVGNKVRLEEQLDVARDLQPTEQQALFDMEYYLPDDLLVKVDRASMRYSLEARVPLLDHRLVEFALNVDPSLKMRGADMKYLLKQVLYRYVPKQIFDRPKWGFGMPLVGWLSKELRHLPETYLSREVVEQVGLVKWEGVNELVTQYFSGKDYLYNRVWVLILLHRWALEQ